MTYMHRNIEHGRSWFFLGVANRFSAEKALLQRDARSSFAHLLIALLQSHVFAYFRLDLADF